MLEITEQYLIDNPKHCFVFGDNLRRFGIGGAAKLRHLPNTYGFITKKAPTHNPDDYYKPQEYTVIFENEVAKLLKEIKKDKYDLWLISKIGAGLANKYNIWENVISFNIKKALNHPKVKFLF